MTQRWRRADNAISRRLPASVLLLSLDRGEPVEVTGPGADLWQHLEVASTVDELIAALAPRHATADPNVRRDVRALLEDLDGRGLVTAEEHDDDVVDEPGHPG